jgi:DNA/RNA-binding domain of Phe-tRNA-synthetase-like protein
MKLKLSSEIIDKYPDLKIGIIVARNVSNVDYLDEFERVKRNIITNLQTNYQSETLSLDPRINSWREVYRSFGVNPKKFPPTAEAIIKRALKKGEIPSISPAVDSYLLAELEHFLPCGGYDLEKLMGDLELRFSNGGEEFVPLGARDSEKTESGEIIYSDNSRVLTRMWNYKDCDFTKITNDTKNLALFIESPTKESDHSLVEQTKRTAELLQKFCGGDVNYFFLNANEREYDFA